MEYTKGEWKAIFQSFNNKWQIRNKDKFIAWLLKAEDEEESKELSADAQLISAAPDMYEALKECLALLDKQREEYNNAYTILPHKLANEGPIAEKARKAIAKAEGKS